MTLLEQLMHEPETTAQQILDAADDAKEVADAAALVLAEVERVNDDAKRVLDEHQAAIARSKEMPGSEKRIAVMEATGQRAKAAVAAAQTAWQRYQPWKEALDRIDAALEHVRIVQSN